MGDVAKKSEQESEVVADIVDDKMIVQMTAGQLRVMFRDEVDRAVQRVLEAKPASKSERWVDVADAAAHFKVTPQTIRNWCKEGAPHRTFGSGKTSVYRIDLAVFEAWVDTARRSKGADE